MKEWSAELLAPAGGLSTLKAAIHAGCDAVYIGGSKFGARAYAENAGEDDLRSGISYAHLAGKKVYLTINTLLKEEELEKQLVPYLMPYYQEGLDAVIVQDLGVFSMIRSFFPDLPIHASTQMAVTGPEGASFLEKMGASRVVTARELSLKEIREIRDHCKIEIESFVHGALCYSYSGQCLLSSLIGGRSGNRGRCAQPCRLPYEVLSKEGKVLGKEAYYLSTKDMNTLRILPEIVTSGVYSLKIEGRMKKPEYTAGVVSIYRKYLDYFLTYGKEGYQVDPKDQKILFDLFNRNGFHESYYETHNGKHMITIKKPDFRERNERLFAEMKEKYLEQKLRVPISGNASFGLDFESCLTVTDGVHYASVMGPVCQEAKKQPLSREEIKKRFEKTGDTPFEFQELTVETFGNVFLPHGVLNQMRRDVLNQLEEEILRDFKRDQVHKTKESKAKLEEEKKFPKHDYACLIRDYKQAEGILSFIKQSDPKKLLVYVDSPMVLVTGEEKLKLKELLFELKKEKVKVFLALPYVYRQEAKRKLQPLVNEFEEVFDGYLIRNLEELAYFSEVSSRMMILDAGLYTFNRRSVEFFKRSFSNISMVTLPYELNEGELHKLEGKDRELIVYGHPVVMVSANCIMKTTDQCDHQRQNFYLKDRKNSRFPVSCVCDYCYNVMYNSLPLSLLEDQERIGKLKLGSLRAEFLFEGKEEVVRIMQAIEKGTSLEMNQRTRGHFKRGVE